MKYLKFLCAKQFINEYPTSLNNVIQDQRTYFRKLTHLEVQMQIRSVVDKNSQIFSYHRRRLLLLKYLAIKNYPFE